MAETLMADEMLVCENHRDKRWPDECECGPGMSDNEPIYGKPRAAYWEGYVYIIRDVCHANGKPSGICQYATVDETDEAGGVVWRQCEEGVLYTNIKPLAEAL